MSKQITEILIKTIIFSVFSAIWFYVDIVWNKCILKKKSKNNFENDLVLSFFVILLLIPLGVIFLVIFNMIGFFLTDESIQERYTQCLFLGSQCIYN